MGFAKQISNMSSGILTPGTENDADFSDDASLVPVTETDDSSYVIYPAPSSATTFASTQSLEDMVLVGSAPEGELDDK